MSEPWCVSQAGHHLLSLVGIRASSPWLGSSLSVQSPQVTPVPPSHTFALGDKSRQSPDSDVCTVPNRFK